ncbi:hypothetical protein BC828DRAFT_377220 [Blastocladiella britannica]|nr:hypothetical protein BC828DRAFT_377220 [Blastocladiella britannica]
MTETTATTPLSVQIMQPWDPHQFDKPFAQFWSPFVAGAMLLVGALNATMVLTAVLNRKLRAEVFQFASNALFFAMCTGNALYLLSCFCFHVKVWAEERWEQVHSSNTRRTSNGNHQQNQDVCLLFAAIHVYFLTYAMSISIFMTLERLCMVLLVRRMPRRLVVVCIVTAIGIALANTTLSATAVPVIFVSGLSCGGAYPLWLGIFDLVVMCGTLVFLVCGNGLCYWKLRKMVKVVQSKSAIRTFAISTNDGPDAPHAQSNISTVSANTKDNTMQRRFAIRGILAALATSFTIVPMSALIVYWSFLDRNGTHEVELATVLLISLTELLDPLIVLGFDAHLKAVMLEAIHPRWRSSSTAPVATGTLTSPAASEITGESSGAPIIGAGKGRAAKASRPAATAVRSIASAQADSV